MTIQKLSSLETTEPLDPNIFAFFKGLNAPAQNGILTADVIGGLPAGAYRICSINSSTNHQPVLVNIAQHGSLDDCSYVRPLPCTASYLAHFISGCSSPSSPVVVKATAIIIMVQATMAAGRRAITRRNIYVRSGSSSPFRTPYDRLTATAETSVNVHATPWLIKCQSVSQLA